MNSSSPTFSLSTFVRCVTIASPWHARKVNHKVTWSLTHWEKKIQSIYLVFPSEEQEEEPQVLPVFKWLKLWKVIRALKIEPLQDDPVSLFLRADFCVPNDTRTVEIPSFLWRLRIASAEPHTKYCPSRLSILQLTSCWHLHINLERRPYHFLFNRFKKNFPGSTLLPQVLTSSFAPGSPPAALFVHLILHLNISILSYFLRGSLPFPFLVWFAAFTFGSTEANIHCRELILHARWWIFVCLFRVVIKLLYTLHTSF